MTRDLELAQLEEFSVIKTFSVSVIQTTLTRPQRAMHPLTYLFVDRAGAKWYNSRQA